ncbi:MAG: iron-sulfur cluster assembly scaffold protein [candidate division WWE3 bacterium]|nr:iron-sulfur cluster assembly scaffold protein [candidate division WWE3 bacterium]
MDLKSNLINEYKHPHNYGKLTDYTHKLPAVNASCGDDLTIYLNVKGDIITDVSFEGTACAISTAATSLLTNFIKGKSIATIKTLTPENIFELLGTSVAPGRLRCALLPLETLKNIQ